MDSVEFIIYNADRINGDAANYTIQTRTDNIRLPSGKSPNRCKIVGIGFSNGLYNVNSTNNVITIFETGAGSNTVVTLPQGQYSATQLATQVATSFTAASQELNVYTATYNSQTYMMTITSSITTFDFVVPSTLLGMLANTVPALTQVSTQAVKLLIDFLYVRCSLISEIKNTSQTNVPGSFTIPLNSVDIGTSAYIAREVLPETEHVFYPNETFKINIFDPSGNHVDLHGTTHHFVLELYRV